jgi:hypothetical protein
MVLIIASCNYSGIAYYMSQYISDALQLNALHNFSPCCNFLIYNFIAFLVRGCYSWNIFLSSLFNDAVSIETM